MTIFRRSGRIVGVLLLSTLMLTGCQTTGEKQAVGGIVGGALGGLLGAQVGKGRGKVAAAALGAVAGLLVGSSVGASLDEVDKMKHRQTASRALENAPSGQASSWRNPDSGARGSITPTRTYERSDGSPCREFTQTIVVGGRTEEGVGRACRQADGSWKIVS